MTKYLQDWRAPEKELKGGRVRPSREGESGQSFRRHPVCGLWTKPSSRGTKQESGAQILQTGWPLCLEVYVPQSRTPVEKGQWRRVGLFRLSVSCQCVCIPLTVFTHTHSLFLYVFCSHQTHLPVCGTSFSLIFYLVSLWFFLFAVSVFPFSSYHLLYAPSVFPRVHTSSFTPPLHPLNVGGQQNNIQGVMVTGSPLPVVSSCYCPTAAWLLHSINRTHTGLITTACCCAQASIMEKLWRLEYMLKQDTWGNLWTNSTEIFNNSPWVSYHMWIKVRLWASKQDESNVFC